MLVLTRKEHERITIGDGVEVVVLAVYGQRVKLGIQAAADTRISRAEQSVLNGSGQPPLAAKAGRATAF